MPKLKKTTFDIGFKKPRQFYDRNREQNNDWDAVEIVILHENDKKDQSQSRKIVYPNFPDRPEFCHEEFLAYRWFYGRKVKNNLTNRCDVYWEKLVTETRHTGESLEFSIEGAGCVEVEKMKDRGEKTSLAGTTSKVTTDKVGKKTKVRGKKKSQLSPIPVLEYHHDENVPFAKPKSPMFREKSAIYNHKNSKVNTKNHQIRIPLAPIERRENTIKPTRRISVSILTNDEAFASLSIHKGNHVDKDHSKILLDTSTENFPKDSESIPSSTSSQPKQKINPFDPILNNQLLEKNQVIDLLKQLQTCTFKDNVAPLSKGKTIGFGGEEFCVIKSITKGGFGTIFSAKSKTTGETYALKQERPPNIWEYYVSLEVLDRLRTSSMHPAFISITHALIGDKMSILAMPFSRFGTLIDVNNLMLKVTSRLMDEKIVLCITKQLLMIFEHLHSAQIIHADVKPDNFLVISEIESPSSQKPFIQLIDFGIAIDVKIIREKYPDFDGFDVCLKNKCIEMREGRLWTYQLDWYGVANTVHAMLFGEYMEVKQDENSKWRTKTAFKRYFQQETWGNLFENLLNIQGESPDVPRLIKSLEQKLSESAADALNKVNNFNKILKNKK